MRQLEQQLQPWAAAPVAATLSRPAALSLLAGVSDHAKQALKAHTREPRSDSPRPEQELSRVLLNKVSSMGEQCQLGVCAVQKLAAAHAGQAQSVRSMCTASAHRRRA